MSTSFNQDQEPAVNEVDMNINRRSLLVQTAQRLNAKKVSPGIFFQCFWNEEFGDLEPRHYHSSAEKDAVVDDWIVNPSLIFEDRPNKAPDVGVTNLEYCNFLGQYSRAWLKDPWTDMWTPYWINKEHEPMFRRLVPKKPIPNEISDIDLRRMGRTRIAVSQRLWDEQVAATRRQQANLSSQLSLDGCALAEAILPPLMCAAVRRYYRSLLAAGKVKLGDGLTDQRFGLHSEALATYFHKQFTAFVGRAFGVPVKPSFAYFTSYQNGASLRPHLDREQAEYSISLLVDYSPEPDYKSGWPLYVRSPDGTRWSALNATIGDGMFLKGRQLEHYRDALSTGHFSTSLLLHYVDESFKGDLW